MTNTNQSVLSPYEQVIEHHVDVIRKLPTLEAIGYLKSIIQNIRQVTDEQKKLQCIAEIQRSVKNIDAMLEIIKKQNEDFDAKYDAMQKQNEEFANKQALLGYEWPRMSERVPEKPVIIESNSGAMIDKGSLPESKLLWIFLICMGIMGAIVMISEIYVASK